MKEKIIRIINNNSRKKIKKEINIDELKRLNLVEDLEFDSIGIAKLIIDLEDQFDIIFDESDLEFESITNAASLIELIVKKVNHEN